MTRAARTCTGCTRKNKPRRSRRLLQLEAVEPRRLMAIDLSSTGTLTVMGTHEADAIKVDSYLGVIGGIPVEYIRATVTDAVGTLRESRSYQSFLVNRLWVEGLDGNDFLQNMTSLESTMWGGNHDDTIIGSSGVDTLDGGWGNDTMAGGGGNDQLFGGPGVDRLSGNDGDDYLDGGTGRDYLWGHSGQDRLLGGWGNDILRGGSQNDVLLGGRGNDRLFGQGQDDVLYGEDDQDTLDGGPGNDSLYGGSGYDALRGGDGNDGLYGGSEHDTLEGGNGSDRFLLHMDEPAPDDVSDYLGRDDARIQFHNGAAVSKDGVRYAAASFTPREIEIMDQALAAMHQRTGNNELLQTKTDRVLKFFRHGAPDDPTSPNLYSGWNREYVIREGRNTIHLTELAFSAGENWLVQTTLHEVGHNWDNENPRWGEFKDLSWSGGAPLPGAAFASNYALNGPREDFAESFAAYFMDAMGRPFGGSPTTAGGPVGAAAIPLKIAFLDRFFDDLAF